MLSTFLFTIYNLFIFLRIVEEQHIPISLSYIARILQNVIRLELAQTFLNNFFPCYR